MHTYNTCIHIIQNVQQVSQRRSIIECVVYEVYCAFFDEAKFPQSVLGLEIEIPRLAVHTKPRIRNARTDLMDVITAERNASSSQWCG